jgi:nucleotide-binding universal stress UspA family protein
MTVLVAVAADGISEQVLSVAVELGRALDDELYVVHLTRRENATTQARDVRDELQSRLGERDVAFSVGIEHVDYSGPRPGKALGRQVVEIANDTEITHIVMGHQSKHLVERLREGDTAFAVADEADVPVTVVPETVDTASR